MISVYLYSCIQLLVYRNCFKVDFTVSFIKINKILMQQIIRLVSYLYLVTMIM